MNGLKELKLKKSYDSDVDDVLNDFYVPALSKSVLYRRLAGFFSSSALSIAAKGIAGLIANNGKMELVVGAKLQKKDIEAIQKGTEKSEQVLSDFLLKEFDKIEEQFVQDHVKALGWMVSNNHLSIKVAIPIESFSEDVKDWEAIFHQKVGILYDNSDPRNIVSFSGSVNESEMGWLHSIEEFKVFRSWIASENDYIQTDLNKFQKYWDNCAKRTIVMDIPKAIKEKFIEIAPKSFDALNLEKHYNKKKKLWPHQNAAIKAWVDNEYRGIFAMATGTGKTFAALSATSLSPKSIITIVLVPTLPLLEQWSKGSIPKFDKNAKIIVCGGGNKWKTHLSCELAEVRKLKSAYSSNNRLFVVSTMATASSKAFRMTWKGISPENVQIIIDEVHHFGAPSYKRCAELPSSRRLGLSATPERGWDFNGNRSIEDYVGATIFEYDVKSAIDAGFLAHYNYSPHFAYLSQSEFEDFQRISDEIGKEVARINSKRKKTEKDQTSLDHMTKNLEKLLIKRAKIKKKTADKIRLFRSIISKTSSFPLIVFCEDTEQLDEITEIINEVMKSYLVYTSEMSQWRRNEALDLFYSGDSDVILAIRCLDEGIDIPKCKGCIVVASSSSPREFIQRRGRILRGLKGKIAEFNDIIVLPPNIRTDDEKEKAEILIRQEIERMKQLVLASDNEWSVRNVIRKKLAKYGLEELSVM